MSEELPVIDSYLQRFPNEVLEEFDCDNSDGEEKGDKDEQQ